MSIYTHIFMIYIYISAPHRRTATTHAADWRRWSKTSPLAARWFKGAAGQDECDQVCI